MRNFVIATVLSTAVMGAGCDRKPDPTPPAGGSSVPAPGAARSGDSHDGHDHGKGSESKHGDGHSGEVVDLGTTKIGDLTVRASRDKSDVKAGGDLPIDVWLTSADGKPAPVAAVRFWIGTQDAKGSVKSKADIENSAEPNHWHTHAEVPSPMPEGSRLWVEIEATSGQKSTGSFDLRN